MEVVYDDDSLKQYMAAAVGVTPDRPILIDRFLNDAMECEADAISDGENVLCLLLWNILNLLVFTQGTQHVFTI